MKRIIVTRFSAMGDVAMVASVLAEFQAQHHDTEIIMVSRKFFASFFENIPRLIFHPIDPQGKHKGLKGLFGLFKELKDYQPNFVADLHNNIRSRILDILFSFKGYQTCILNKGRSEKKALTRPKNKIKKQLQRTTERYADVFRNLGFEFTLSHKITRVERQLPRAIQDTWRVEAKKIGIAPFAQHKYKVFPLEKMEQLIHYLSDNDYIIYIFGGGKDEQNIANAWQAKFKNTINTIGSYTLSEELAIISQLDLMITMDSSGMHMASLVGTRCLSLWGATHPFAGFLGYGQQYSDCIQVEHTDRPSSVYGNKPCICDGQEAIDLITLEMIIDKLQAMV